MHTLSALISVLYTLKRPHTNTHRRTHTHTGTHAYTHSVTIDQLNAADHSSLLCLALHSFHNSLISFFLCSGFVCVVSSTRFLPFAKDYLLPHTQTHIIITTAQSTSLHTQAQAPSFALFYSLLTLVVLACSFAAAVCYTSFTFAQFN